MSTYESLIPSANAIIETSYPLYLHPAESAHPIVVDTKLSGIENYHEWKRQMEFNICTRRKLRMLTGLVKKPTNNSLREAAWDTCNSLLISWILHNVEPQIKRSVMYSETAKDIWDYLQRQFSVSNGARKFRLNKDLDDLEQGEKTICSCNLSTERSTKENYKTNVKVKAENAAFFADQTPPDTRQTCPACKKKGHVREKCWRVVGYPAGHRMAKYFPAKPEGANFQSTYDSAGTSFKGHKTGASKGRFQKYPNKGRMAANAMTGEGSAEMAGAITLTTEQFEQLMSNQKGKGMSTYPETEDKMEANFAGMALISCNNVNVSSYEWIIDSGAYDHMISDLRLLENCKELKEKPKISLPNGGASHVSHTGSFQLKNGMKLNKVLYVPTFKHNLLSLQKLIKDEHCIVLFYEHVCAIHDSHTKKIRALGKEDKGIYYLVNSAISPQTSLASVSVGKCDSELCNINSYFVSSTGMNETEGIIFNSSDASHDLCKDLPIINEKDGDIWHLWDKDKFQPRGIPCIFLGYPLSQKGYRVYDIVKKHVFVSRDVKFYEKVFPCKIKRFGAYLHSLQPELSSPVNNDIFVPHDDPLHSSNPYAEPNIGSAFEDLHDSVTRETSTAPTRPPRTRRAPAWAQDFVVDNLVMAPIPIANVAQFYLTTEDATVFTGHAVDKVWVQAMNLEIQALDANHTWLLTELPKGRQAIGFKWIFKTKYNPDGSIERHKARLVIQGFKQRYGLDYEETFAPVAKMSTVTAMAPSPCQDRGSVNLSPLARLIILFIKQHHVKTTVVLVYVDDMVIAGDDLTEMVALKAQLSSAFLMKDLGELKYLLGLEIDRSSAGIFISQRRYTLDLLSTFGMHKSKALRLPVNHVLKLEPGKGIPLPQPDIYIKLVGKLIYLTISRPDISFSVQMLSQFLQSPTSDHMQAARRVLKYLKSAPGQGVLFASSSAARLTAYCDSDWASCAYNRKSTIGYCVLLRQSPISWKSKKQSVVSRSSTEAEYRATAMTTCEITWLFHLLQDLGLSHLGPAHLKCDNQAALAIAANPVYHERTKHIEVDCHFIREKIQQGLLTTSYVNTKEQVADILTKSCPVSQHHYLMSKMGVSTGLHSHLEG
ncbi:uncharacterized protein LOC141607169 [Silene latifolia]|uniref:uncharacterized protein LOC141607169 n=1 Tax=Silene latifolia TaxID=37657 RepID=UPI003D780736